MADDQDLGMMADNPADNLILVQRPNLSIEKGHVMTSIRQGSATAQQPKRWKLLPWNAAANRRVSWIDDQDAADDSSSG